MVLFMVPLLIAQFGGDLTRAVVFWGAARASVGHMNTANRFRPEAGGGVFPDSHRRPISILGLADSLGMPYETVRRHVQRLVTDGLCERTGSREFLIRAEVLERPEMQRLIRRVASRSLEFSERVTRARIEASDREGRQAGA